MWFDLTWIIASYLHVVAGTQACHSPRRSCTQYLRGWVSVQIISEDGGVREFEFDDDQHQLLICPDMDTGDDSTENSPSASGEAFRLGILLLTTSLHRLLC